MTNAEENQGEQLGLGQLFTGATIQPAIPPHIAGNLLEFLRRVQSTGMEAVAWVEAYQFVQKHAPQQSPQPGVPFGGLPPAPPK